MSPNDSTRNVLKKIRFQILQYFQNKSINSHYKLINMGNKSINRIKVVLAERKKTNKWLAEQLKMNETTISRWCTNSAQPSVETLVNIAKILKVDIKELFTSTQ